MSDTTRLDLDAIEARANEATPGPWESVEEHGRDYTDEGWSYVAVRSGGADLAVTYPLPSGYEHEQHETDAEFIAHAREDVPALVARVRELEAEVERLQSAHNLVREGYESAEGAMRAIREVLATNARAEAAEAALAAETAERARLEATIQRVREWEEMASRGGVITAGLRDALDGGPDTEEADR